MFVTTEPTADQALVRLRPRTERDMLALLAVYASSRAQEMKLFPFSAEQTKDFLHMQFMAQHTHYQTHYADASFDCIEHDGKTIGRLYVHRGPREIRIVDICLLPELCNRSIGSGLLGQLVEESDRAGQTLTAHVEVNNRARSWYARFGFLEGPLNGPYIFITRNPLGTSNFSIGGR